MVDTWNAQNATSSVLPENEQRSPLTPRNRRHHCLEVVVVRLFPSLVLVLQSPQEPIAVELLEDEHPVAVLLQLADRVEEPDLAVVVRVPAPDADPVVEDLPQPPGCDS